MSKDFKYKAGSVDNGAAFDHLLDVALLYSGQLIVEDNIGYMVFFAVRSYLLELTASDIGCIVRTVYPLDEFLIAHCPGSLCQELEFVQILLNSPFVVRRPYYSDEYRFLCLLFVHFIEKEAARIGQPLLLSIRLLSELEDNREGVGHADCAVPLLSGGPLRRAGNDADSFFVDRRIHSTKHADVCHSAV